jgi:geranylgeranyl pyrophosphate synthase
VCLQSRRPFAQVAEIAHLVAGTPGAQSGYMVALLKALALPLHDDVDAHLFEDERRLHEEVQRFVRFATRHADEPSLRAQLKPILNVSGKKVRPLFPFWLMRALGGEREAEAVARVAAVTLVLHSAAIVIDDIEDGSLERQAQASLHLRNGLGPTLNSASLLIFAALEYLGEPSLTAMAIDAVSKCHLGQALDLSFADPRVAGPLFDGCAGDRETRWLACARMKTSQLMEWSLRATATVLRMPAATIDAICGAIVEFGVGYQILDDVKNLRPDLVGTKAWEDLPHGLRSWVCLELLRDLDGEELARARAMYGSLSFVAFVRQHPRLSIAVERSMLAGEAFIAAAVETLQSLTLGRERGYLSRLLGRPLEDLQHAQ